MLLVCPGFMENVTIMASCAGLKGLIETSIDFSSEDILLIYGHFKKKVNELNLLKSSPNNPIHVSNINQDIKLFSSITDKIEKIYPQICEMNKYL